MPRIRAVKAVATTVARMFVSRNNDVDGYWGIGKLFRLANAGGNQELVINLLEQNPLSGEAEDVQIVRRHFQSVLQKQLTVARLRHVPVAECSISVHFAVAYEKLQRHERFGYGAPIECAVTLALGSGHTATAVARCRAAPHDPSREQRRHERMALTIVSSGF